MTDDLRHVRAMWAQDRASAALGIECTSVSHDGAVYTATSGQMRSGDALLLYTDGMVESRTRDISLGIDKMLGQFERLLRGEFEGGAARLVEALGSRNDDAALLLVHRR